MNLAIMQPYFLPYIGYFQLMKGVDKFVVYDNIKFTKKGWINRNRILQNGNDSILSLPIKKDSDYYNVNQRYLADGYKIEREKLKRKICGAYAKAPYFQLTFSIIEKILDYEDNNLFNYIFNSIEKLNSYLNINVDLIKSSSLNINIEEFKGASKVVAICKALGADTYINPIGGLDLYDKSTFKKEGISLLFIKPGDIKYAQFNYKFVPNLSIIDILMFNDIQKIDYMLQDYELI